MIGHEFTSSKPECFSICQNDESCSWISLNKLDSICLIFSSCPTINEDQLDFTSGQLECDMSDDLSKDTTVLLISGLTSNDVHVHQSEVENLGKCSRLYY